MARFKHKVTFIDLFAGIGGFHLGIRQAAKKLKMDTECLLAIDIDEKARRTYKRYFGIKKSRLLGDVTDGNVKNMIPEDVDIICAGFPCQPFSLVGKKMGLSDDRGTLFNDIVEIVRIKQPKVLFLENVRNLVKHDNGEILRYMTDRLNQAGYMTDIIRGRNWEILKASDFGLPTRRPRFYLVTFRKDIKKAEYFKFPLPTTPRGITLRDVFGRRWPDVIGSTIRVGGRKSPFRKNDDGTWFRDRRNWDTYLVGDKPHVLTVEEIKKMMGFPPNFKFADGLSDPQAMKQLGNSVAVPVIKSIAENIIKTIYDRSDIA